MEHIKYIVFVDYYCEYDNRYIALSAQNEKDAMLEAPALLVDKIFWQATTMIEKVFALKLYKYEENSRYATYCQKKYITNLCNWEKDEKIWSARIEENVIPQKL